MEQLYRMDYAAAEKTLIEGATPPSAPLIYFSGVACLNRFFDWGDTAALRRAETRWEELSPRGAPSSRFKGEDPERLRLYRGLAGFQLSYAAALRGHRIRSAALAYAARDRLLSPTPLKDPEARAALMLYDYYQDRILERLPFVGPAEFPVATFEQAVSAAGPWYQMLRFSLFWIHIDAGRHAAAAAIAGGFLERYPQNRLARQLRGDAMFRSGDLAGARVEYEKLREEYAAMPRSADRLPLGYYRAVGNLARIHAALGERRKAEGYLAEWNRAGKAGVVPWLPPSLKREVSAL